MTEQIILTKHELRRELLNLDLYLQGKGDKFFIIESTVGNVYATIDNQTSEYKITRYAKLTSDEYKHLETLLSDYCHTDPLVRDAEKEFVLRATELPCFHFAGGYEFLGVSPFGDEKYTHVQMDKAKVFTYKELKDILETYDMDFKDLTNRYEIILV